MPFSAVWSGSTLFTILSILIWVYSICRYQTNQGLHWLPFSEAWSGSTLFAILSCLINVYTVCHSQQSDQGLHYLPFFLSSIMKFYTVSLFQQSNQGLHCFLLSTVWSGSTLFAILSKQFYQVFMVCHTQQYDQGLHYLPFSGWSGSTLFGILNLIRVCTICHSHQWHQCLDYLRFFLSSIIKVYIVCHS